MNARLKQKLDDLIVFHEELLEDLPEKEDFMEQRLTRRGIEKTIQLIADTIIDIAYMIISEKGYSRPADGRDAITVLEKEKVLNPKLAAKIRDLVSFRNLLVHRYGIVDEKQEYENISENHQDILNFVREIKKQ
ncbi:MAG: DUF86 domain-containing protein [Nanoarchaeota archaeon]